MRTIPAPTEPAGPFRIPNTSEGVAWCAHQGLRSDHFRGRRLKRSNGHFGMTWYMRSHSLKEQTRYPLDRHTAEVGDLGHDHAGLLLCDHLSQWTMGLSAESGGFKVMCSRAQADGVLHRPVLLFEIVSWHYEIVNTQIEDEVHFNRLAPLAPSSSHTRAALEPLEPHSRRSRASAYTHHSSCYHHYIYDTNI